MTKPDIQCPITGRLLEAMQQCLDSGGYEDVVQAILPARKHFNQHGKPMLDALYEVVYRLVMNSPDGSPSAISCVPPALKAYIMSGAWRQEGGE